MLTLTVEQASEFVRKNLDEMYGSTDDMLNTEDTDNAVLDELVAKCFAEAVRDIHLAAPAAMLEGQAAVADTDYVLSDNLVTMTSPSLRLVSFKASDSDMVITQLVAEDSPEGRQQLNEYLKGTHDDPCLVLLKESAGGKLPKYRYYSFNPEEESQTVAVEFIPYPEEEQDSHEISTQLRYHTLNYLTGMVLDVLGEYDKAQVFYKKASFVEING